MYYILNQNEQIVAVDPELLSQLAVSSVDELYQKISLEEIVLTLENEKFSITENGTIRTFSATKSPLTGTLGELILVSIDVKTAEGPTSIYLPEEEALIRYVGEKASPSDEAVADSDKELSSPEEDLIFELKEEVDERAVEKIEAAVEKPAAKAEEKGLVTETEEKVEAAVEGLVTETEENIEKVAEEAISSEDVQSLAALNEADDDIYDLLIPSVADKAISKIKKEDIAKELSENETIPIYIDVETVSRKIGISTEDYNLFLDEYINTALSMEKALKSDHREKRVDALHKLSHLANVLHLPHVDGILRKIENTEESEHHGHIASFFTTLSRLTTTRSEEEKVEMKKMEMKIVEEIEPKRAEERVVEEIEPEKAKLEIVDEIEPEKVEEKAEERVVEEKAEEKREETPAASGKKWAIDLSDVKPIRFDFQLDEAAKDLNLPVELIEEFVNDFIAQAHKETDKMLEAYEKGDLETVQKIGHLLKGTSSNLRIIPLSDTLYDIQFNDDIGRVPELVRNYWGHFLALENQIKLISK